MGFVKTSHPPYAFTEKQYDGLLAASLSATIISLLASFAGLIVHFLLLWYDHHRPDDSRYNSDENSKARISKLNDTIIFQQPNEDVGFHNRQCPSTKRDTSTGTMNRVSLRLIVVACISYSIYSVAQIAVTGIQEKVLACRVLAYFIICFDVMGSICLGLVGFNLVMVFVVNVRRPERLEKYYYAISIMISIFVFVPPLILKAGRTMDKNDSCWYHFFFEGREANTFNWLYYYSWLLFASILAAVSSIISIRKVMLEKNNFAHTINMLNREELSYPRPAMHTVPSSISIYNQENMITTQQRMQPKTNLGKTSELFRRVAIRCICYALVPVLCKSWGIGIEIAITSGIVVNYPILVIDRFMSCIMGFFVSCIYFSDPSVQIVWRDMMIDYKKRYVDQFYYADVTKVVRVDAPSNDGYTRIYTGEKQEGRKNITHSEEFTQQGEHHLYTITNYSSLAVSKRTRHSSYSGPVYIFASALKRPAMYHLHTVFRLSTFPGRLFHRTQTSKEEGTDTQDISCQDWCYLFCHTTKERSTRKEKACWIPMHRVDEKASVSNDDTTADPNLIHSQLSIESIEEPMNQTNGKYTKGHVNSYYKDYRSRILEPYANPIRARLMNWFIVNILLYRPPHYRSQKERFKTEQVKGKDKCKTFIYGDDTASEIDQRKKLQKDNRRRSNVLDSHKSVKVGSRFYLGTDDRESEHAVLILNNIAATHKEKPFSSSIYSNIQYSQSSPCLFHSENEHPVNTEAVCKSKINDNLFYPPNTSYNYALQASTRMELERKTKAKKTSECPLQEVSPSTSERIFSGSKFPLKGRKPEREIASSSLSQAIRTSSAPCSSQSIPSPSIFSPLAPSWSASPSRVSSYYRRRWVMKQDKGDNDRHYARWYQTQHEDHRHQNPQIQCLNAKQHGPYERNCNQTRRLYRRHHMSTKSLDEHPKLRGNVRLQLRRIKEDEHPTHLMRISGDGNNYDEKESEPKNYTGDRNLTNMKIDGKQATHGYMTKDNRPSSVSRSKSALGLGNYYHLERKQQEQVSIVEGLSPPSKRHYAYVYRRIVTQKSADNHVSSICQTNTQAKTQGVPQQERSRIYPSAPSSARDIDEYHHINETQARSKTHNTSYRDNQLHFEAAQEILLSGVRTILLHISDKMNINTEKNADDQQQNEKNRITVRIYAWATDLTPYHYSSTPNFIHYL